jgi:biopolymer transport protein TolR
MAHSTHDPDEPITQINVVPLVDIMLVLLIIFMLTASFIAAPSVPVRLPKAFTSDPTLPRSLSVVLDAKGEVFFQGKKIERTDLTAQLRESAVTNPELRVVLSADESVTHGKVVELLDMVRQAGVTQVALGVEKP